MLIPSKVGVSLGERSYPVYIGAGLLGRAGELLARHGLGGTACVVTQREVWKAVGPAFRGALAKAGYELKLHLPAVRHSEAAKSVREFLRLVQALSGLDGRGRGFFVAALGGGVVGDLAGFAAAVYRRGIPYVQVPTTLTAQVDSAIGGKTGVDLPQGKNLLGAVHQPRFVLVDPDVLRSLPPEVYRDGLAEVVKYAVIRDGGFFRYLEKNRSAILERRPDRLAKVVAACVRAKAGVVARDEFDRKGVRMVLNFGHTIGHGIEAASGYRAYTHGQAVSIGMLCALELSAALGILKDPGLVRRCEELLRRMGLPVRLDRRVDVGAVLRAVGYDKKNRDGKNRFVLVEKLGRTRVVEGVPRDLILSVVTKRREG